MRYALKITPPAFSDIENGIDYYDTQQNMLGKKFSLKVNATLKKIKLYPLSASFAYDDVRYKVVDKFPYVILYAVQDNIVAILRVFNTYQRPVF
jgi:toxin ParE1/3/4